MHNFQHSRGRILFEVACAFGISACCVWAWMQTYATAMLPAAAIAGLYGLVHAFDMVRRNPRVDETVGAIEPATEQGDLLEYLDTGRAEQVVDEVPEFTEPPPEAVAATDKKRKRKSPRQTGSGAGDRQDRREAEPEPEVVEAVAEAVPEVAEPEPGLHVVDTAPDEPEYVPATPLFEAEPYVRMQRAAFGRKAR